MRKHRYISLVISLLVLPCFGQFSDAWTDYFAVEIIAREAYSGSVERCYAASITPDTPSWWDYWLGKNRAKLISVKNNLKACRPYYMKSWLADTNGSFIPYLSTNGPVDGLTWSNDAEFLADVGLPTNYFDETPYFKLQYPSESNGWQGVKACLTNMVATKREAYWWTREIGSTNYIEGMGMFMQPYGGGPIYPMGSGVDGLLTLDEWALVSTNYEANARGAWTDWFTREDYSPEPAYSWEGAKSGVMLALTNTASIDWPIGNKWSEVDYVRDMYGMHTWYDGHTTNNTISAVGQIQDILQPFSFGGYMRVKGAVYSERHSDSEKPHIVLGGSGFYIGEYATNYMGGSNVVVDTYQYVSNISYSVEISSDTYYSNIFYPTGTVVMATNVVGHYETNLHVMGLSYAGYIHTDVVAVITQLDMSVSVGTNSADIPYTIYQTNSYGTPIYGNTYATNSEGWTNFVLVPISPVGYRFKALKSQLAGAPYCGKLTEYDLDLYTNIFSRSDFYENLQPKTITRITNLPMPVPDDGASMGYYGESGFQEYYLTTNSEYYEDFSMGYSQGWTNKQNAVTNCRIVWGNYFGTNDLDFVVDESWPYVPEVGSCYSYGWGVKDNFAAVWWNVTNGFKYR
jgi:hypothetical protein